MDIANRTCFHLQTTDGARLVVEHIPASGEPVGALWCAHAMMANRRSLDRPRGSGMASVLATHGLEVYVADLRDHGEAATNGRAPTFDYAKIVFGDLPALTQFVRDRHPKLPIGAIGHSLSAHGVLAWLSVRVQDAVANSLTPPYTLVSPGRDRAATSEPESPRDVALTAVPACGIAAGSDLHRPVATLDAVITLAANMWMPALEPDRLRWWRKRIMAEGMLAIARTCGRFPTRRLRWGSDDVALPFVRDLARVARAGQWSAAGIDFSVGMPAVQTPVLAVLGDGDRFMCHPSSGRMFHAPLPNCEIWQVGQSELGFAPDHMGLATDIRSAPLWSRMARWLCGRFAAA